MGDGQSELGELHKTEIQKPTYRNSTPLVRGIMPLGERRARKELAEARTLAQIDPLTHLLNRRGFLGNGEKKLAGFPQELAEALRFKNPLSLAYLDLDHLKALNDTYGHHVVDKILERLGETLLKTMRTGELAARLGGDEFALLFPGTQIEAAELALQRIQATLKNDPILNQYGITFSCGLTHLMPEDYNRPFADPIKPDEFLKRADAAAYRAKAEGRDRIVQWKIEMQKNENSVKDTKNDLPSQGT